MAAVSFVNEGRSLDALPGSNLRAIAHQSGIQIASPFSRIFHLNVKAGPVKVFSASDVVIVEGKGVNNRSEEEEKALGGRFLRKYKVPATMRLASQVTITGDVVVQTGVRRELDAGRTKEQTGYLAVVSVFAVIMLVMFVLLGLDLVKEM
ncbi:MAG TPA: hypothetical protein VMM37_04355 [Bacteroidota bacterium]|nr:hypothetical protein [Bacteroidota bacterium]